MSELQPRLQDLEQVEQKLGLLHGIVSIDEEIDFAELYMADSGWESLRNGLTPDIEQMEMDAFIAEQSAKLEDPKTPLHMLGHLYYASLNGRQGWVSLSRAIGYWIGAKSMRARIPDVLHQKLLGAYDELIDEGLAERNFTSYRLHQDYDPSHDFPDYSDDFEEVVTPMLRQRPLGAWAPFIVQAYFREIGQPVATVTPYEYWAARYEVKKMQLSGVVDNTSDNRSVYMLARPPEPELPEEEKLAQSSLDDAIGMTTKGLVVGPADTDENFETKLRQVNLPHRLRLRKPQQRGRW